MNQITLNGVSSSTITGLLIQSLPPISLPMMRTQREEIDGRDGDIVTKLGYQAYDKTITIGLKGNYDVDEVIAFFASEGNVVFSNEPDKYYRYQMLEQIDFERLIRFKQADVTFHVQPFKFAYPEQSVREQFGETAKMADGTETVSGITWTYLDDTITMEGFAVGNVVRVIQIDQLRIGSGVETQLRVDVTGEVRARLYLTGTGGYAEDAFGGQAIEMSTTADTVYTLTDTLSLSTIYSTLRIEIDDTERANGSIRVSVVPVSANELTVDNDGNTVAKPAYIISGAGTADLYVNGFEVFQVRFTDSEPITIDVDAMNAYSGGTLKNRNVTGDYNNAVLDVGQNVISWDGTVLSLEIIRYSRWL
ncbi:MAG: phage tail family protein [Anaerolineaceae bacterium]|nr:phage tail family protein [Anaerolineaceae bacterium]